METTRPRDRYDQEVERLSAVADAAFDSHLWRSWSDAGPLFGFVSPSPEDPTIQIDGAPCGCLTQVRGGCNPACTSALTEAIRADKRIPTEVGDIRRGHLPVFAEWQRKIDSILGRTPPPLLPE